MAASGNAEGSVERGAGGFAVLLYAVDPDLHAAELAGDGGGGLDCDGRRLAGAASWSTVMNAGRGGRGAGCAAADGQGKGLLLYHAIPAGTTNADSMAACCEWDGRIEERVVRERMGELFGGFLAVRPYLRGAHRRGAGRTDGELHRRGCGGGGSANLDALSKATGSAAGECAAASIGQQLEHDVASIVFGFGKDNIRLGAEGGFDRERHLNLLKVVIDPLFRTKFSEAFSKPDNDVGGRVAFSA